MGAKTKNITAMLIFGTIGIFVRKIPLSSSEIALTRGLIGGVALVIFTLFSRKKLSFLSIRKNIHLLIPLGVAVGLNWIFFFQGYKYTTISNATLSYYFAPVFVTLLSTFILKEKLTLPKFLCVLVALLGMGLIVGVDDVTTTNDIIGIGYGLIAAGFYAGIVITNKFLKDIDSIETTVVQLFIAGIVLIPYVFLVEQSKFSTLPVDAIPYILILGVVHTALAYLLYFSSLRGLDSQRVAILSYIDPVFAILMSSLFLKENLGISQIVGGILILGSSFVSETLSRKK